MSRRGRLRILERTHDDQLRRFPRCAECSLASFSYFTSEAEERFAPDLALLVSLIAEGSLKPQIGAERSWRDILEVTGPLRGRSVAGKAVLLVDRS